MLETRTVETVDVVEQRMVQRATHRIAGALELREIRDEARPGDYDFRRGFIKSSNTYFVTNGLRAGIENFVRLGQRLHLGERTGLPTGQEVPGNFPTPRRIRVGWTPGDTANLCIGQGFLDVTPLQMALMTAAAVAHVNRMPVLFLPGDVFAGRGPDPLVVKERDGRALDDPDKLEVVQQPGVLDQAVDERVHVLPQPRLLHVVLLEQRRHDTFDGPQLIEKIPHAGSYRVEAEVRSRTQVQENKLAGVITVDDVIDVIKDEATEDLYRLAGVSGDERAFTPAAESLRKRLPWLGVNLVTAFVAASVVAVFESTIERGIVRVGSFTSSPMLQTWLYPP